MWFFKSPHILFGEDALSHLETIEGKKAFIVTDAIVLSLGFVDKVEARLKRAGLDSFYFAQVEPEPSLETVRRCAAEMANYQPDWVIGLGGGSSMDAAKAAWFCYERPDVELEAINPVENFGLRKKARLITIPTTAGSGSEVSQAAMIKDVEGRRKLYIASYEIVADITIVDPFFSSQMPRQLTADTGIDVLTHAIEGYNNNWSNDFSDGLCLQATRMVFKYLPRAVENGADSVAREKMANAATIAGLVIGSSNISLAHALGHSAGAIFPFIPHGRVTGLMLPLSIEYTASFRHGRYIDLARILGMCVDEDEVQGALVLADGIRDLLRRIGQPVSLGEAGVTADLFQQELENLCDRAEMDLGLAMSPRIPDRADLLRLFTCAFEGRCVDF